MSAASKIREGEPLRFSLASVRPLPDALLDRTRRTFAGACSQVRESHPAAAGLFTLSLHGSAAGGGDGREIADGLRSPALALGVDCALARGRLAERGPGFIRGEVIDMLAQAAGSADLVADVTARAMAGELDFAESLALRVATLEGLPTSALDDVAARVETAPGAEVLVRTAHAHGAGVGLVSGGFHEVVDVVAARLGVDRVLANLLEARGGRLTGRTSGPVVTRRAKAAALAEWAACDGVELAGTVAMGDGANDVAMMEAAELSVAVCAKPVVLAAADAVIASPRLDALPALLGWDAAD